MLLFLPEYVARARRVLNTFFVSSARALLVLCMTVSLCACSDKAKNDSPCQIAAGYERLLEDMDKEFEKLNFWTGLLEGLGLSTKGYDLLVATRKVLEEYREHLYTCPNSNCRNNVEQHIKEINNAINACKEGEQNVKTISSTSQFLLQIITNMI